MRGKVAQSRARIVIECGKWLGKLVKVALVRTRLVIRKNGTGGFELMINLRDCYHIAMACEESSRACNRSGDLEDFGKQEQARVAPRRGRPKYRRSHSTG